MENEIRDKNLETLENPPVGEVDLPSPDGDEDASAFPEGEGDAAESAPDGEEAGDAAPDYAKMAEEDLLAIRRLCPHLATLGSLADLPSAFRFGELRELGLSVSEALGALGLARSSHDTRSHLRASVPKRLGDAGVRMSPSELEGAKRLFPRLGEREIARLYRRVNQ